MHELNKIRDHTVSVLDSISRPAAPYYERYVKAAVFSALDGLRQHPHVQIGTDRYGNIIARYRHPGARFDASLATAAHMDHPGFHIVSVSGDDITASIQGGLPRDDRLIGSSMHIFRGDREIRGTIRGFADASHDTITVTPESDPGPVLGNDYLQERDHAWGVPAVERFRVDGDLIHGRAMDDLAGCAQQIVALQRLVAEAVPVEFTALFNRAEEVGFLGAVGACELGSLPAHAVVISLEASKNLEGARPGEGIILRTGDRQTLFDASVTELMQAAAAGMAQRGVPHRKRRMDGGTCEGALYLAYGYETGALAVPLINYHNHGETAVEAEAIHADDLAGGVILLEEIARCLAAESRLPRSLFREQRKAWFYKHSSRFLAADDQ